MQAWQRISSVLNYIEDNIGEPMTAGNLARIAGLSNFYFQRLFSRYVKKPVAEYIKLRRLARSTDDLRAPRSKTNRIIDIAVKYGFSGNETYTRAFTAAYGMPPKIYRSHPVMLNDFDVPDLEFMLADAEEGVPVIAEDIVLEINRRRLDRPVNFMGLAGYVPIDGQMPLGEATSVDLPGELWLRFHKEKHLIPRTEKARETGVAYMGDAPEGYFTYFTGAETEAADAADGFKMWQLMPGNYAVCAFEAPNFKLLVTRVLNKALKFFISWMEKNNIKTGAYSPEIYYPADTKVSRMELWMPLDE